MKCSRMHERRYMIKMANETYSATVSISFIVWTFMSCVGSDLVVCTVILQCPVDIALVAYNGAACPSSMLFTHPVPIFNNFTTRVHVFLSRFLYCGTLQVLLGRDLGKSRSARIKIALIMTFAKTSIAYSADKNITPAPKLHCRNIQVSISANSVKIQVRNKCAS